MSVSRHSKSRIGLPRIKLPAYRWMDWFLLRPLRGVGKALRRRSGSGAAVDALAAAGDEILQFPRALDRAHDRGAQSEAELRKLAAVAERTNSAVIVTSAAGRIEWVNAAFTRITEYTLAEVAGKTPDSCLHGPETDPNTKAYMQYCLRKGRGFQVDLLNYGKSGRKIWLAVEMQPIRDEQGRIVNFTIIQSDITDRKMAEESIRASEVRTRRMIDNALDAVVTIDPAGTIVGWNSQAEVTFGWSRVEALGQSLAQWVIPPLYREAHRRGLERYLATGEGVVLNKRLEITALRRSGEEFPIELAITPVKIGDQFTFSAFIRDITDRKRAEMELKASYEQIAEARALLEQQTITFQLQNEQLNDARRRAEAANQTKSEFLANMSHEIRTPMTAILGFADVLMGDEMLDNMPHDRRIAIETIKRNGEHLLQLINDILDLSKIEAGKLTVEHIRCSPRQVVADAISLMKMRAVGKGLSLDAQFDGPIPETIQTDPTRLRQILINILGNAVKFTETGGIRLSARFLEDVPQGAARTIGPRMQFDIIDTGIGLGEEQIARLFRPFTQADMSTTRRFGGTGLGLTICKRLAAVLGGDVAVKSTLGEGSTFRVTIATGPLEGVVLLERPSEVESRGAQVESPRGGALPTLSCRILLAEDGPDNQRLISFVLKKAAAEVTVVDNGQSAVEKALEASAAAEPFDVILMDMQMPVLDGYGATSLLRSQGYGGIIVALTAHAMAGDRDKCIAAGCDEYATKPIDRGQLLATIQQQLQQARDRKTAPPAVQG